MTQQDFKIEIAHLLVNTLNLEMAATDINPEAALFGPEGLGLDSIDALEIAFAISKEYGIQIKSGDTENETIFASLNNLSDYIEKHQTT